MAIHKYTFGALYVREIRGAFLQAGVELREQKGFLESDFYVDDRTLEGQVLIRALNRFGARLIALDRQEEEEERREKERRRNHWFLKHFVS